MCVAATGLSLSTAAAQPAEAPAASAAPANGSTSGGARSGRGVEEVVVTAQRRAQRLSRIGVTVNALGATQLKQLNVKTAADLARIIPAFQAAVSSVSGAPIYTLRGVGFNTQNITSTAPVGLYVDEVAYAYPYMILGELFDLERVEVLKGPQGTLYGRNTTGGLVDYVSAKPTDKPVASLTAGVGNYDSWDTSGFISGPITPNLKGRLAFESDNRDGDWQHSITRDDGLGKYHRNSVRTSLDWTPTDRLKFDLTASYWQRTGDTQAGQAIGFIVPNQLPAAVASLVKNPISDSEADWTPASNQPGRNVTGITRPLDHANVQFFGIAGRGSYEINENLSLVSLTNYNYLHVYQCSDAAGVQTEQVEQCNYGQVRSFAEEGRLLGNYGPLKLSVGGYYANDNDSERTVGYAGQLSTILGLRALGLELPSKYTPEEIENSYRLFGDYGYITDTVKAGFASAEYQISPQFKVTAGGRWTEDSLTFTGAGVDQDGNNLALVNTVFPLLVGHPVQAVANGSYSLNATDTGFATANEAQTQDNFAFRVSLDYTPTPDQLYYVQIARGYKAGTFPVLAASTVTQLTPVSQEELTDYEIGSKLSLIGHSIQLNTSAFFYDYTNRQVYGQVADLIFGTLPRVINIPKSEIYGIDTDVTWRITSSLTARGGGSAMQTVIDQFVGFNEIGQIENFKGEPLPYAPKFQGFASLAQEISLNDNLGLQLEGDGSYQSTSYSYIGDLQDFKNRSYFLFNMSATLHAANNKWNVSAWMQNITNQYYWTTAQLSHDSIARFAGMPRTFGIRATYNFF
jgi:outer membrane receptor protein involved in Fe transport